MAFERGELCLDFVRLREHLRCISQALGLSAFRSFGDRAFCLGYRLIEVEILVIESSIRVASKKLLHAGWGMSLVETESHMFRLSIMHRLVIKTGIEETKAKSADVHRSLLAMWSDDSFHVRLSVYQCERSSVLDLA